MTEVYDVTTAGVDPASDRAHRTKFYLISMTLRVVCILACFLVPPWWNLLGIVGAVVLPYLAVMVGNNTAPTVDAALQNGVSARSLGAAPGVRAGSEAGFASSESGAGPGFGAGSGRSGEKSEPVIILDSYGEYRRGTGQENAAFESGKGKFAAEQDSDFLDKVTYLSAGEAGGAARHEYGADKLSTEYTIIDAEGNVISGSPKDESERQA
ncbi:MAG: DUF3099 domain-containing protein [Microbacteriaceae bacterium]|nr:DUF3099 domain-containing protein [Microbacteriaceae bacterium]